MPLIMMAGMLFSVLGGLVAASGSKLLVAGLLGVVGVLGIFLVPMDLTFWLLIAMTYLVAGNLQYFLNLPGANWMPYMLMGVLSLQWFVLLLFGKVDAPRIRAGGALVIMFVIIGAFSSLLAKVSVLEFVIASKSYIIVFVVPLLLGTRVLDPDKLERLWKFWFAVTVIQFPFALYEYLFVAKKRAASVTSSGAAWDSVVGTFGGNAEAGGASHPMAFVIMLSVLGAAVMLQSGKIGRRTAVLVILSGIGAVLLAEVKAFFLFLPLLMAIYYYRELFRRPLLVVGMLIAASALLYVAPIAYEKLHYSETSSVRVTNQMKEGLLDKIENQLSPELPSDGRLVLTRMAHLALWWDVNVRRGDGLHALLGYGMGATHQGRFESGAIAKRFPYKMDETGMAVLLWEVGVVGAGLFCLILLSSAVLAHRLARASAVPEAHRALLRATGALLLICVPMLVYHAFLVTHFAGQLTLMLLLGYVAYWNRSDIHHPSAKKVSHD